jgi:hypothetical protein
MSSKKHLLAFSFSRGVRSCWLPVRDNDYSFTRISPRHYGYNGRGLASNAIPRLAAIPTQDFNGSTAEFAFRCAF